MCFSLASNWTGHDLNPNCTRQAATLMAGGEAGLDWLIDFIIFVFLTSKDADNNCNHLTDCQQFHSSSLNERSFLCSSVEAGAVVLLAPLKSDSHPLIVRHCRPRVSWGRRPNSTASPGVGALRRRHLNDSRRRGGAKRRGLIRRREYFCLHLDSVCDHHPCLFFPRF